MRREARSLAKSAVIAVLAWALTSPAFASGPQLPQAPEPPVNKPRQAPAAGGLFGPNEDIATSRQTFNLMVTTTGDYNANITPPALPVDVAVLSPLVSDSYYYSEMNLVSSYNRRWDNGLLRVRSTHSMQYNANVTALSGAGHSVLAGFDFEATRRVRVFTSQSVAVSPFYGFVVGSPFGVEDTLAPTPPYNASGKRNLQMASVARARAELSRRTSLSVDYGRSELRFTGQSAAFTEQSVGAGLRTSVNRDLGLRAGYRRRSGDFAFVNAPRNVTEHDIDVGVDFHRVLSRARQTTVALSTGSAIFTVAGTARYRMSVNASASTNLAARWTATASFSRGLQWIHGLDAPVFADVLNLGVVGYASDRVQISVRSGYSMGEAVAAARASELRNYMGVARLGVAVSRYFAVSTQYLYYHYTLGAGLGVIAGMPPALDRQAVRVGCEFWLPILR